MLGNLTGTVLLLTACWSFAGQPVKLIDFTKPDHGWHGNPRTQVKSNEGVFTLALTGEDPWVEGPQADIPGSGKAPKLRITLDASCSNSGECRLFFAAPGQGFTEENAVNLESETTSSKGYSGIIPFKSAKLRFRIDPPGSSGSFTLRALNAEPLTPLVSGKFAQPLPVKINDAALTVETKRLKIVHSSDTWNSFEVYVSGSKMAQSNPGDTFVYWNGSKSVEISPKAGTIEVEKTGTGFRIHCRMKDADGAEWTLRRDFSVEGDVLTVSTTLQATQTREIAHLPWLTLFAGTGTFGTTKHQALLPGVEYLADEPSSNEREIKGAAANRLIVENYKLCYPLMAITAENRWIAIEWNKTTPELSPVFDSPDRIFNSGGHLMGLWSPAAGEKRFQGELEVYAGATLEAGRSYRCQVTISGGEGNTVAEVIEDYISRKGLPPLPQYKSGFDGAVELLAHGWLDSAARDGLRWRHAVFGDRFPPSLAPDVPSYLLWLAANTKDTDLKARLRQTAASAIRQLPAGCQGVGGVSHVKLPTGALLYGDLETLVTRAAGQVKGRAASLARNGGRAIYKASEGNPDYASTLGSDHCNGFTAIAAERMLQDATLTGDRSAVIAALAALDKMTELYAGGVPRGAQPWEMPLHTPDIMASAGMVRCYTLGYLLSGRADLVEQARYWAWTGVSMVYLAPPVDGEIGLYATIGVMGATNWVAPNWIGQPVQWCGLVYRSALEELARVDRQLGDTWRQIARGITITGLQMTWPADDPENRGGLLPDYLLLKAQKRDGPAINPGTVQANLAEAFAATPMYTVTRLSNGMLVHVPGEIKEENCSKDTIAMNIDAWPEGDYKMLITGIGKLPARVLLNDKDAKLSYLAEAQALIIHLAGDGVLTVTF